MSKLFFASILAVIALSTSQVFAASSCVAEVPNDCQIVHTVYTALSGDDIQSLQIDCLKNDGSYETLIAKISLKAGWAGVGRNIMPTKILYKKANREDAALSCQ